MAEFISVLGTLAVSCSILFAGRAYAQQPRVHGGADADDNTWDNLPDEIKKNIARRVFTLREMYEHCVQELGDADVRCSASGVRRVWDCMRAEFSMPRVHVAVVANEIMRLAGLAGTDPVTWQDMIAVRNNNESVQNLVLVWYMGLLRDAAMTQQFTSRELPDMKSIMPMIRAAVGRAEEAMVDERSIVRLLSRIAPVFLLSSQELKKYWPTIMVPSDEGGEQGHDEDGNPAWCAFVTHFLLEWEHIHTVYIPRQDQVGRSSILVRPEYQLDHEDRCPAAAVKRVRYMFDETMSDGAENVFESMKLMQHPKFPPVEVVAGDNAHPQTGIKETYDEAYVYALYDEAHTNAARKGLGMRPEIQSRLVFMDISQMVVPEREQAARVAAVAWKSMKSPARGKVVQAIEDVAKREDSWDTRSLQESACCLWDVMKHIPFVLLVVLLSGTCRASEVLFLMLPMTPDPRYDWEDLWYRSELAKRVLGQLRKVALHHERDYQQGGTSWGDDTWSASENDVSVDEVSDGESSEQQFFPKDQGVFDRVATNRAAKQAIVNTWEYLFADGGIFM